MTNLIVLTVEMLLITIGVLLFVWSDMVLSLPTSLSEIKYPLTREDAFHKLTQKSDFVFDFYHPREMDIIKGADAGLTVRAKVIVYFVKRFFDI